MDSIAERTADKNILVTEISKKKPGDVITYEEFQRWLGWDLRANRGVLYGTVTTQLRRDYKIVLSCVPGTGYKVCTSANIVDGELPKDRRKIRRVARRCKDKAGAVDLNALNEQQKIKCLGEVAIAHTIIESAKDHTLKKIQATAGGEPPALNHMLDAVKRHLT